MGDEWKEGPEPDTQAGPGGFTQDDLDKRIEDIRRRVIETTTEAQQRIKRVVDRAGTYWQRSNTPLQPRQPTSVEEERIRRLANNWSMGNWQIAKELGTYMDVVSWSEDEVWEIRLQTRWETRSLETISEPYTGRPVTQPKPLLPVWDYELPVVTGLKAPESRVRLQGQDEVYACSACNSTGRLLCSTCTGRGWVICPDCKGRTRLRCNTCKGRGYIADWQDTKKKSFFQKRADNLASNVGERVSDIFENIRQQGVPIGNPIDTDPASKGRTIPCPDCVNGEVECTCGTGKRVCATCQGAKTELCPHCGGTGKVVRYREVARRFDLTTQTLIFGSSPIPEQRLANASGDLVYNAEMNETLHPDAAPDGVPMDVWQAAVQLAQTSSQNGRANDPREQVRASLQVLELTRIPYMKVDYRYSDRDYIFYVYDVEGKEKFYADRYPARWDRVEKLFRSITNDLMAPAADNGQSASSTSGDQVRGYRVPVEKPPYSITEEDV